MTRNRYGYCHSPAHALSRRQFLGATAAGLLVGPTLLSDNAVMGSEQAHAVTVLVRSSVYSGAAQGLEPLEYVRSVVGLFHDNSCENGERSAVDVRNAALPSRDGLR